MKKVLIIQTAFIGDVILATGMVETICAGVSDVQVSMVVRKGNEGLFTNHPLVHEVFVWDKKKGKYKSLFSLIQQIRKKHFDVVINAQRFASSGLLTVLSGAAQTIGFKKNPWSFLFSKKIDHIIDVHAGMHETDRNHELVKAIFPTEKRKPKLYVPEIPWTETNYITISPASVWETKKLPVEKWIELILLHKNEKFFLMGGPADVDLCKEIASRANIGEDKVLAGKFSLLQSAAIMKGARMNYVNDSGPLHLCTATDAPVTAVFCSTIPEFGFGPLSTRQVVIEANPRPACKPCGLHGKKACPLGHFNCGYKITIEQLSAVLPS